MSVKNFVTIRHILQNISKITGQEYTKRIPSPSAQTFDLCEDQSKIMAMESIITDALQTWKNTYPIMHKFAIIQLASGARVSEILRLTSGDISEKGRVLITASKGGSNRIIEIPELTPWLIRERFLERSIFQDLNRFAVHREYKKQGISAKFGINQKHSTTHLFRHLLALDLQHIKDPTNAIKTGLGQKTDQATDYYKTQIRR